MSWQISANAGSDCVIVLIEAVFGTFQSFGHNFGYGCRNRAHDHNSKSSFQCTRHDFRISNSTIFPSKSLFFL